MDKKDYKRYFVEFRSDVFVRSTLYKNKLQHLNKSGYSTLTNAKRAVNRLLNDKANESPRDIKIYDTDMEVNNSANCVYSI